MFVSPIKAIERDIEEALEESSPSVMALAIAVHSNQASLVDQATVSTLQVIRDKAPTSQDITLSTQQLMEDHSSKDIDQADPLIQGRHALLHH